jgi:hypothetical protein
MNHPGEGMRCIHQGRKSSKALPCDKEALMRRISPTIAALVLAGAVCAPVVTAGSASAAECPPGKGAPSQPGGAPAPTPTPPVPAGAFVGILLGNLTGGQGC